MAVKSKKNTKPQSRSELSLVKKIGLKINKHATQKGISIEKLAYESGISKSYLYDLVSGKGNPTICILKRIADNLEITLEKLIK